jgi:hypothetical protein
MVLSLHDATAPNHGIRNSQVAVGTGNYTVQAAVNPFSTSVAASTAVSLLSSNSGSRLSGCIQQTV